MYCVIRWIYIVCDNIIDDIYRKFESDISIIYVCKICRDEVECIKNECRREVRIIFFKFILYGVFLAVF